VEEDMEEDLVVAQTEVDLEEAVTEEVAVAKAMVEDMEVDLVAAHKEVDLVVVVLAQMEVDSEEVVAA
jgi:hypothetical protein